MGQGIRIAIVSPTFGKYGGIESFVFALADTLAKHEAIAEVGVYFKRVGAFDLASLLSESMAVRDYTCKLIDPWSKDLWCAVRRADLVHCQNPLVDVALFSKAAGTPLVQTIHNWRRAGMRPQFIGRAIAYSLARRHWYNSDFVWDSWEPAGRLATSGKPPLLSDLPEGIVPASDRRGFIFVSRWIPGKGLETLLDAYEGSNLNREAWPLTLVGDGKLRPAIEERLGRRPIPGVVIKGLVDSPTRNDLIRHARWMVTPPNTKEDLGLTPIEARHVGVPCIITRDGGLPEAGGKFALICEPGDTVGLGRLLERAASMSEDEYSGISVETHRELVATLQPLSVYPGLYKEVILGRNSGLKAVCSRSF